MDQTIGLLKAIGSPFVSETQCPRDHREITELYHCSLRNRIELLYLMALKRFDRLGRLKTIYDSRQERSSEVYCAIPRVSRVLSKANVEHAIFKTVRPYPYTTVDIDVLVLESGIDYEKSVRAMVEAGYKWLGSGPNSTTVKDAYADVSVDLYREIAVSEIIYLDKDRIRSYVSEKIILPDIEPARILSPPADLVALIAHSVIKEQMYTISEYYSTLHFLADMSPTDLSNFIDIIHANAIEKVARAHIGLTAKLHKTAHGIVPVKIRKITDKIGVDLTETYRLGKNLATPHRFHPFTVAGALLEKVKREEKARRSLAKQLVSMFRPSFARSVAKQAMNHLKRESY